MVLFDLFYVDEFIVKDIVFISVKDRGGLWYFKEYLIDIFVVVELQFCVYIGKEVCYKICVDKIVDILF